MMNLFSLIVQRAYLRTVVLVSVLFLLSFTVSGRQADDPVPEKERTRGDFTANISLAFPVFSSGPEKFGYETKGTIYTHSRMKGMMMGTAYLSLLFGNQTGRLTICPTVEAGVGHGTIHQVPESTRAVFGVGTTLLYRPLKWFHTGIDLKYVFLSNSNNRWLMLGFKFGVDF